MAGLLDKVQREWMRDDFVWGQTDCGLSVLNYVCRALGRYPDDWPPHADETSAESLLEAQGGLLAYAGYLMDKMGLQPTTQPRRGDVGIVAPPIMGPTCAICMGARWMLRGKRQIMLAPLVPLKAWRVA